jgi:hypothetical protein
VATTLIWIFYAGHNFGPGYAGTAMGSLSYPTNIRGISGGYTQAITRVGGIIGAYAFPVLLSAVGQRATIGYIALAPLIGLLFVLLIKWDPIGKDVEVASLPDLPPYMILSSMAMHRQGYVQHGGECRRGARTAGDVHVRGGRRTRAVGSTTDAATWDPAERAWNRAE